MPLTHALLTGSPRLLEAYENRGRKSVKRSPPDEPDEVKRIQKAMLAVEGPRDLKTSFPLGFDKNPTGVFNLDLFNVVLGFQQRVFPGQIMEHDGRIGRKTLDAMDAELWKKNGSPAKLMPLETTDFLVFMTGFADDPDPAKDLGGVVFSSEAQRGGPQAEEFSRVRRTAIGAGFLGVFGSLNKQIGVDKVVDAVVREFDPTRKLIMYGYSAGARNLLDVTRRLDDRNATRENPRTPAIQIDLLVTNDAAAKEATGSIQRVVGKCVKKNLNLFQPASGWKGSHGGENSGLACTPVNVGMTDEAIAEAVKLNTADVAAGRKPRWSPHGVMQHLAHPRAMKAILDEMGISLNK